jgi:hypothetical protein
VDIDRAALGPRHQRRIELLVGDGHVSADSPAARGPRGDCSGSGTGRATSRTIEYVGAARPAAGGSTGDDRRAIVRTTCDTSPNGLGPSAPSTQPLLRAQRRDSRPCAQVTWLGTCTDRRWVADPTPSDGPRRIPCIPGWSTAGGMLIAMATTPERNRVELKSIVGRLLAAASVAAWSAGAEGMCVRAVLAVFLALTLAAWCAPLVVDAFHRAVDE